MVVLMALKRQAKALDRIDNEQLGPLVRHLVEGLEQQVHIVTSQIGHQGRESLVVILRQQIGNAVMSAQIGQQLLAPCLAALKA